jgi:hypothetical protein
MKLVWHHPLMRQKDWIRFIFGNVITGEIEDPDFTCFEDDTIHVVSMIFHPLRVMEDYFQQCRRVCKNIVLYHAGDEWFSGGCGPYKYFDNVVRELPSFFTRSEGIACIPLGSPTKEPFNHSWKPASQRKFIWSFAGEIRNTRIEMVKHFDRVPRGNLIDTNSSQPLSTSEYYELLRESVFAPCGMGNIITETWRVYEAIESGAIPLVERRMTLDYYGHLFVKHPIPTFSNWRDAATFAKGMMNDEKALDFFQRDITTWWKEYKNKLVDQITTMLSRSHNDSLLKYSRRPINNNMFLHESLRVVELLRHQSAQNLRRRLVNPIAPMRRILLGLSKKDER